MIDSGFVAVDVHTHVFLPTSALRRVVDGLAPPDRDEPMSKLWNVLEPAGVGQVVLVPLDDEDSYIASQIYADPARTRGVATATREEQGRVTGVDPVAALRRRRNDFPFSGLRTRWLGPPGGPIRSSPMWPTLVALATEGIVLWAYLPPEQQPLLAELVSELPDLTILLNHLGFAPRDMKVDEYRRPYFIDALPAYRRAAVLALADAPRVHVMLSGMYALSSKPPPYEDLWGYVRDIRSAFGIERLLYGSDLPWIREVPGYLQLRAAALQAVGPMTNGERRAVLADNARRLLRFEETGTRS